MAWPQGSDRMVVARLRHAMQLAPSSSASAESSVMPAASMFRFPVSRLLVSAPSRVFTMLQSVFGNVCRDMLRRSMLDRSTRREYAAGREDDGARTDGQMHLCFKSPML